MAPASRNSEQSIIQGVLQRIDRQLRINGLLDHFSIALCLILGTLVAAQVVRMLLPVALPSTPQILVVSALLLSAFLLWTQVGARQLPRAAGVVDARAGLHDEIKSAYWFLRQQQESPFIDLQLRRAADTARALQPKRLVPTAIPRRLWMALLLVAVLELLVWLPMDGPLLAFAAAPQDPSGLTAEQEDQFDDIRDLVAQAEELEAADDEELLSAEARERLEEALRQLEADQLTMEELLQDLREAQNALDEGNLEMSALQEALEELAQDFENSPELAEMAQAMMNQDLSEAADLMRQLAERLSDMPQSEASELMEQLQQAAQSDQASMEELLEALQQAAESMSDQQMADAEQSLQEAADAMEAMSQRMDAQQLMNQAAQQMQAMQDSMAEQQMSQQMSQQMASQQSGEAQEGAMAMPSDEVQKSAGSGESGDPSDQEGGPAGHATSDPAGGEMQLGTPTTLEVQLETEILDKEELEPQPEELDPEDIFQEASRQQTSVVEYRDVSSPSSYAKASALSVERIPWQYRNLVKRYFLAIKPRESQ